MKLAFSTLACPDWKMPEIVQIARSASYDAVELRFVEGKDALYELPAFRGSGLAETKQCLSDHGLSICCVDTSCRFHFPDASERAVWVEEGQRMAELAFELGAPGIRVFGDTIQPRAKREQTREWIAEAISTLARLIDGTTGIWLETHGDFANSAETVSILMGADAANIGAIWDPANCWTDGNEAPSAGVLGLGGAIKHVHIKDVRVATRGWAPVLTGEGDFPLFELRGALREYGYDGYLSFEWEKKWHPEIPDANVALPHFAKWYRNNWVS